MAKVRYFVDDVDAAVSFYVQHLGFELDFNDLQRGTICDDSERRSHLVDQWGEDVGRPAHARRSCAGTRRWNRFVFDVDDIVSGVGGKQIVAEDPSGNPIEIFQAA